MATARSGDVRLECNAETIGDACIAGHAERPPTANNSAVALWAGVGGPLASCPDGAPERGRGEACPVGQGGRN